MVFPFFIVNLVLGVELSNYVHKNVHSCCDVSEVFFFNKASFVSFIEQDYFIYESESLIDVLTLKKQTRYSLASYHHAMLFCTIYWVFCYAERVVQCFMPQMPLLNSFACCHDNHAGSVSCFTAAHGCGSLDFIAKLVPVILQGFKTHEKLFIIKLYRNCMSYSAAHFLYKRKQFGNFCILII